MTCRNCNFEFCWLCKGNWKDHGTVTGGFYKCNIYEKDVSEGKVNDEEKEQKNAESEIERYTFYFRRYDNHLKSRDLALNKMKECERHLMDLVNHNKWDINDTEFFHNAFHTIIECRRLLAWTYPIGYYLDSTFKQKELFEDLQQQLEKFGEHLHGLLERKDLFTNKIREEIINYTRVTNKFKENMTNGIENDINPLLPSND